MIDTNVFVHAAKNYYGLDFCPAFWDWLVKQNRAGTVVSVKDVARELQARPDDLAGWASRRSSSFFLPRDPLVVAGFRTVRQWIADHGYQQGASRKFLDGADGWLIACALAHGGTVVTLEVPADTLAKVKIPNVCAGLDVRCMNPFEMLRERSPRFVLGRSAS